MRAKRAWPICTGNSREGSGFEDYSAVRFDTFHQLLYPNTYFGWLSIVPRAGFRETYYSETRDLGKTMFQPSDNPLVPDFLLPDPTLDNAHQIWRRRMAHVVNAGVEASFKISREWEDAQSRSLGLDGLRHIIQPFTNFSWVSDNAAPIRKRSFSSIDLNLLPNFARSIFRSSLRSIRSIIGRSGAWASAIVCKPVETISPSAGWISKLTST